MFSEMSEILTLVLVRVRIFFDSEIFYANLFQLPLKKQDIAIQ